MARHLLSRLLSRPAILVFEKRPASITQDRGRGRCADVASCVPTAPVSRQLVPPKRERSVPAERDPHVTERRLLVVAQGRGHPFKRAWLTSSLTRNDAEPHAASAAWSPAASNGAPASCPPAHCAARTTRRGLRMPAAPIKPPAITSMPATPMPTRNALSDDWLDAPMIADASRGGTPPTEGRPNVSLLPRATAACPRGVSG
jgi:hypothetical protein